MKHRTTLFYLLCTFGLFSYCKNTPAPHASDAQSLAAAPPKIQKLTGIFTKNVDFPTFYDCGSHKNYKLYDETRALDTLYKKLFEYRPSYQGEPVWAMVQGFVGNDTTLMTVKQVDSVAQINHLNYCLPYDFMAHGTEPFWDLQVFAEGGKTVFRNIGDTVATICQTPKPQINVGTYIYNATTVQGVPIKMTFKKEESNDGMSEMVYPYSVELSIGKDKYTGVGMRKGDVVKEK